MYIGTEITPSEVMVSPNGAARQDRRAFKDRGTLKISSPFNTSASNVGNAAMQAANIPWNASVEMRLGADGPGEKGAYIEVGAPPGFLRRIPIDDGRLDASRQGDGTRAMALCQQLVDDLAAQIRTAVKEALQGSASG